MKCIPILFSTFLVCSLNLPCTSHALTTLSGGISAGVDIHDRSYDKETASVDGTETASESREDDSYQRIIITPLVELRTETARSSVEFSYAPNIYYDWEDEENDINHYLSLLAEHSLSNRWSVRLLDDYRYTDEHQTYATPEGTLDTDVPTGTVDAAPRLRDDRGRRRYYSNDLSFSTDYTYGEDSVLSAETFYNLVRYDESDSVDYEDYDELGAGASLRHRFDARWSTEVYGRYVRGLYEEVEDAELETVGDVVRALDNDLSEIYAGALVTAEFKRNHPVSLGYNLAMTRYDESEVDDSEIHTARIGYTWLASPRLDVSFGLGPLYDKPTIGDAKWSWHGDLLTRYAFQRGVVSFTTEKGSRFENFTGTRRRGITEYYLARLDYSYEVFQGLVLGLYGFYRHEERDELAEGVVDVPVEEVPIDTVEEIPVSAIIETVTDQQYAAGGNLVYAFSEHYSVELRYSYVQQKSDNPEDEYQDHRVMAMFSYTNDFLRW